MAMPGSIPKMRIFRPAFKTLFYHSPTPLSRPRSSAPSSAQEPTFRCSQRGGCGHSGLYVHLSGQFDHTGYSPERAAPSTSHSTSSPANQQSAASRPARPRARRKMCSEGFLKTHSLEATMNSNRWKGRHSFMRRMSVAPEKERLLITPVLIPSSARGPESPLSPPWGKSAP